MNIIPFLSLIGLLVIAPAAQAATDDRADARVAAADKITDLLEARWFEVELIIFERLDVLDSNTPESLTLRKPRTWPSDLIQLAQPLEDRGPQSGVEIQEAGFDSASSVPLDFTQASPYCFGYPMFTEEDPLHPLLDPYRENDFGDFTDDNLVETEIDAEPVTEVQTEELDTPLLTPNSEQAMALPTMEIPLTAPMLEPTAAQRLIAEIEQFESDLYASSYRTMDTSSMDSDVKSINRQKRMRPLIHLRWRQPVPERGDPQPIHISSTIDSSSPATASGMAKVEGLVEVTVARYLHFAPTLWYHADNLGQDPIALPLWADNQDNPSANLVAPDTSQYMQLKQSRRLRSGDIHYIDHPKIGVIVQVDPVTIPPRLEEALTQLKNGPN